MGLQLSTRLAGSAWADGPQAARESVERAAAELGGRSPGLVLLFPDARLAPEDVIGQAHAGAPGAVVAGIASDGVIAQDGVRRGGCAALAFAAAAAPGDGADGLAAGVGLARGASRDLRAAGRAAAQSALAGLRPDHAHLAALVFLDPLAGDASHAIDGAYDVLGASVPLAGGGANGLGGCVFTDAGPCRDAVVVAALASREPIRIGIGHGCRARAMPAIVTRADGRAVREIDGRPAEEVYLEGLGRAGAELADPDFEALAVLHPLAQPELRGDFRLRHVLGRADGGGLRCATRVPANAAVWFTDQSEATIVASARDAVHDALRGLGDIPRAALVFDCAARKRALGSRLDEEARGVVAAFGGAGTAVAGLYTRGEVGRRRGAKGDLNHAIVVVAFA